MAVDRTQHQIPHTAAFPGIIRFHLCFVQNIQHGQAHGLKFRGMGRAVFDRNKTVGAGHIHTGDQSAVSFLNREFAGTAVRQCFGRCVHFTDQLTADMSVFPKCFRQQFFLGFQLGRIVHMQESAAAAYILIRTGGFPALFRSFENLLCFSFHPAFVCFGDLCQDLFSRQSTRTENGKTTVIGDAFTVDTHFYSSQFFHFRNTIFTSSQKLSRL